MRRDLFDILDLIQSNRLRVKLGTNATLVDSSVADRLAQYRCIEAVTVSVDGPEAIHDDLRGIPGTYEKTISGLKRLVKKNFITAICALLTPQELSAIDFLILLTQKAGIDRISFVPEMFYSSSDIDVSSRIVNNCGPKSFFLQIKDGVDIQAYTQTMAASIAHIKKERARRGVFTMILPRVAAKFPREFFSGRLRESRRLVCKQMSILNVMENGDVRICPFLDISCGNIVNESIEEIWNNEAMRRLRKTILSANLMPICSRCCAVDYHT